MRALVVGLGSIGRRHARNWAELGLGDLAVCTQHRSAHPEPLGLPIAEYDNLDRALEAEQPDVVIVANPTSLHVQTACTALQAGSHVLIEKPLDRSMAGVADLLGSARASKRAVMVAYNLRFHPGLARLKTLVDSNTIGRIVSARADVGEYLPDWHPWEDYRDSYAARRDLGGGAVLTSSHEIDALCWLLGTPRRLTAIAKQASSLEIDVEDVAEIVLEFERGALGSIHLDYVCRPPRRTMELIGEAGVLRWDYHRNRLEHFSVASGQWRIEQGDMRWERNQMYRDELRHFVACARGEIERPLIDGEQGAAILSLALEVLRSSSEGRSVDFRDADTITREWLSRLGAPVHA